MRCNSLGPYVGIRVPFVALNAMPDVTREPLVGGGDFGSRINKKTSAGTDIVDEKSVRVVSGGRQVDFLYFHQFSDLNLHGSRNFCASSPQ